MFAQYGLPDAKYARHGTKCKCQFGNVITSALSNTFQWCTCDPQKVLLASFEAHVKTNNQGPITRQNYASVACAIRCICAAVDA